ncbi:hypothetical protein [Actinomadura fibrosa]|uniref:Uncharacterized protein n=1 Tax=Actinomadura fibrosa TaxID=111802 RepID=A0ABW2XID3_9ACTN|nr:hypothetical protein [Actinomadura fibrosa]
MSRAVERLTSRRVPGGAPSGRRSVAGSAALLRSDAERVDHCAARLRALVRRLRDDPAVPPWFAAAADAHLAACAIAAADLSRAAAHLDALAATAPPSGPLARLRGARQARTTPPPTP